MIKDKNYLEDAKELLDFDNMIKIIAIKYLTTPNEDVLSIEVKPGEVYKIFRYNGLFNSGIIIQSPDGRELNISTSTISVYTFVSYKIFDNACLKFNYYFSSDDSWNLMEGKVDSKTLEKKLSQIEFCIGNKSYRHIGVNKVKTDEDDIIPFLEINNDYIWTEGRYRLSSDCERLLSIKDEEVPTKEVSMNFDESKEKEIYRDIITNSSLNDESKKELINNFILTETREYYEEIVGVYERNIPIYKKLIYFMDILSSNKLKDYMFSKEEMRMIVNQLNEIYDTDTKEYKTRKKRM